MKKKTSDSNKKKGKKKKVVKKKEAPIWGDPDCKSFAYHPVTGKPLNPFPNLREQESIIPFFSEQVKQKRQELDNKKKKEKEENQNGTLYRPINISLFGTIKEEGQEGEGKNEEIKSKPNTKIDLHRFEWMNKESWIRCRLRQKGWSYNDMFLNVQCSWTLLRLKMEIKKHLFEGSLLLDNILIYKDDLSKIENHSDEENYNDNENNNNNNNNIVSNNNNNNNNNNSYTQSINNNINNSRMNSNSSFANNNITKSNNESTIYSKNNNNIDNNSNSNNTNIKGNIDSFNNSKSSIELESIKDDPVFFSKNQECNEPLYKLFPRIYKLKSIGNMIPFNEGYTKCDDNEFPILVVRQRPIHIYEPPPPPPPPPAKKKVVKKKKKEDETKKKSSISKVGTPKKKKVVKKKKKAIELPPEEPVDPNAPHEPNDNEILELKDEDVEIYYEPTQILKNPDQYLYIFFDVNVPFVSS